MVRELMHDPIFLAQKSEPATAEDLEVARDLLETLEFHKEGCVGMAANMIGQAVRIIVFDNEGTLTIMLNPELVKKAGPYDTEEGCLSLEGRRKTRRYQVIRVKYQDMNLRERLTTFTGWTAQIIQHELDHLEGILI